MMKIFSREGLTMFEEECRLAMATFIIVSLLILIFCLTFGHQLSASAWHVAGCYFFGLTAASVALWKSRPRTAIWCGVFFLALIFVFRLL